MKISCEGRERIFLDGSTEEWKALEEHAASCPVCAEEVRAWKQLSAAAAELRNYREAPALWARIESSLRERQNAPVRGRFWRHLDLWPRLSQSWQMALAGAMVLVLGVSGSYLYTHRTPANSPDATAKLLKSSALAEVERTEREYTTAIDKLAADAGPQLNSETPLMANYREKLMVLDSAIAELRAQAGENPSNAHLRYQLLAMYQEKQQTLEEVLEIKR
jgi:hypothetical protein